MELTREQELLNTILQKAWEDEDFKSELMANPVESIRKLTGKEITLPDGKSMIVNDQTDATVIHLNIPPKPNMEDVELNEEQLDMVSGGGDPPPIIMDPSASLTELLGD